MNTVKCKECKNYDVIRSGQTKTPRHGWCSVKSVYPFQEGPGQVFPEGVKRVAEATMPAKPEIVMGDNVIGSCTQVRQ
jgi:hypothetical protein